MSILDSAGAKRLAMPEVCEREAVRLLKGVGGGREWWIYNRVARIGHLRVPLTDAEAASLPRVPVDSDAGDSGPQRRRTR